MTSDVSSKIAENFDLGVCLLACSQNPKKILTESRAFHVGNPSLEGRKFHFLHSKNRKNIYRN
jgi:hypothetical protein